MATKTTECLDIKHAQLLLDEQLNEIEEHQAFEHIGQCEKCRAILSSISGSGDVASDLKRHFSRETNGAQSKNYDPAAHSEPLDQNAIKKMLAPTDDPSMLGRLGSYEVCGIIGQGSTGIVAKVFDGRLNRFVAAKFLAPVYLSSGAARQRFEREARAVAAVSHENVVPVHSVGDSNGMPYFVMQYFPGGSLQQRIEKSGALEICEVVRIGGGCPVCC